jgi:hypothetical protein
MPRIALNDPRYYLNRHVQWLDFIWRTRVVRGCWALTENIHVRAPLATATGFPHRNS